MSKIKEIQDKALIPAINALLAGCETLLDIGAGMGGTLAALKVPVKLGLEIHRPYLEKWPEMDRLTIPLNLPARALQRVFLPKTIDAVTFIDSLEHLRKDEAKAILTAAEKAARRIVIVFMPCGPFPQYDYDAWSLGGEVYQRHRSAWTPEDFVCLDYDVTIFTGFHNETNAAFRHIFGPGAPPVDALLAYKRLVIPICIQQ